MEIESTPLPNSAARKRLTSATSAETKETKKTKKETKITWKETKKG